MKTQATLPILLLGLLLPAAFHAAPTESVRKYKICVPETVLDECNNLAKQDGVHLTCVPARDRLECLDKVHTHKADFVPVDPEDMYIAANNGDNHFAVFKEIRTKEEPNEEFRYEAVAVIHKNQPLRSVQDLKGLKSCHTGVGRNVGYKIPLTKLSNMHVIGAMNDKSLTARENELRELSNLFSKACLVGNWAADPELNKRLKKEYANLCALCEHPDVCNYPDYYSGYDGALRCLSDNGGEVAWTKVYYVKKHFGIQIGGDPTVVVNQTGYNPNDYAYFCPDGSKKPILGRACRWAARPWQGYLASDQLLSEVPQLRQQLKLANTLGEQQDAKWLDKVLLILKGKTAAVDNAQPLSPQAYLNKANYSDVIGRNFGPNDPIRFCVTSTAALAKCRSLSAGAFSRDIRPRLGCVVKGGVRDCLAAIRDGEADVISLDGGEALTAVREYDLKPILSEVYGPLQDVYYAVAVIKKNSNYQSFADLRGAKSCHTGIGRTAGWVVPVHTLLRLGLVQRSECPAAKAVSDFFSGGSCAPGALLAENNPTGQNPSKLCDLCVGNSDKNDASTKCYPDVGEDYFGYTGAFRCLAAGAGDVAFVKHSTVLNNTDGHNSEAWARDLKSSDYELLCPDGGRKPLDQFESCNLAAVPGHLVVTSKTKNEHELEAIRQALLAAANLYSNRPDLFRLFGPYEGKHDLLFKDSATGLKPVYEESQALRDYEQVLTSTRSCETAAAKKS
uniref:Transferrin n=3 Tax=cellular organisms TaxID=131567 RepID=A0A2Z6FI57_LOCMI|nr:transferrin [Locusta migratoria]